jgi:hypothetical protein
MVIILKETRCNLYMVFRIGNACIAEHGEFMLRQQQCLPTRIAFWVQDGSESFTSTQWHPLKRSGVENLAHRPIAKLCASRTVSTPDVPFLNLPAGNVTQWRPSLYPWDS